MRKGLLGIGTLVLAAAVLVAGSAGAATVRVGTLVLHADGGFEPQLLPKRRYAPIQFQGYGEVKTTDGSIPPSLQHVKIDFDRDGLLTTAGLAVCRPAKIEGASPQQARHRCRGAMVGTGHLAAAVSVIGLARLDLRSPLTVFNGPRRDGNPTVVLHAQAPFPISETYVVVAPIERIHNRIYGYRTAFDVPPIAATSQPAARTASCRPRATSPSPMARSSTAASSRSVAPRTRPSYTCRSRAVSSAGRAGDS